MADSPATVEQVQSTSANALRSLAGFAACADIDALPAHVTRQAQACLLYGLAVGLASRHATAPRIAAASLDIEYGAQPGQAVRFLDGKLVSVGAAAFANAVLLHSRVQEDAHPTGHVGVVVVPAALAVAQRVNARGADLLAAIVAGYEVALRIGRDHTANASSRGFRSTSLYGVFGAAAAASRLMGLNTDKTANALALAANATAGLREFVNAGTEEFPLHAGTAARDGISAAHFAQAGVQAAGTSLEGGAGFFNAYGDSGTDYGARLTLQLGQSFEFLGVTYKPYPVCQFNRSVIRGVLDLRARAADAPLERMTIRMNPFEADFVGMRYTGPFRTFPQTFMSVPFCAGLAWSTGGVSLSGIHDFDNSDVRACIARIEVVSDPERPRYQPAIELRLRDGQVEQWQPAAGTDTYALSWDAANEMAKILCREVNISDAACAALISSVDDLASAPDVTAVLDALHSTIERRTTWRVPVKHCGG